MIELLVVLSIVMVLTSLLMPGILQARQAAFRLMCATNLRQIGVAMLLRAEDNNGNLPESYMQSTGRYGEMCAVNTGTTDEPGRRPSYDGLGTLWEWRYLETPKSLYCPAHRDGNTFESDAAYYQSLDGSFDRVVHSNYHYTGPWRFNEEGQAEPGATRNINRVNRLVLVTDALRSREEFSHENGLNLLYSDGSTIWAADTDNRIYLTLPPAASLEDSALAGGMWVGNIFKSLGIED